ncbi:hypothetical protein SARC_03399 [Sphaeroforma arctica JP610]|uniref:Uncharacterized protein n=1 Tax=Sphaeroforma arctica JP610 TaxID=667725 RepID=A0A0L0G812_9EUKA|nr:hypothetical protein SARC_03399 [Sphaeroforma arctica JP610]KNC84383.1 hypothetical protein SARC_03399 [Sphaeroforma arctica JP610]|eukprot:XP_014158285.1 hypothetical protein SARC_03399 [Sphaeroforma arctica JP610]
MDLDDIEDIVREGDDFGSAGSGVRKYVVPRARVTTRKVPILSNRDYQKACTVVIIPTPDFFS